MDPAPVAVFVYRRPTQTKVTLETLASNHLACDTDLFVFCDGPKSPADLNDVSTVREVVRQMGGFKSITIHERNSNVGLARSVVEGIGILLRSHDRVIVLEDDIMSAPDFLKFMNQGLAIYADDPRVASIHGYVYPSPSLPERPFFLRGADCWGWATWSRAWEHYQPNAHILLEKLARDPDRRLFDFDESFRFTEMLQLHAAGRIDSWAICWYASAFLEGMLTLYPPATLVRNIGVDGSGSHGDRTEVDRRPWWQMTEELCAQDVREDERGRDAFAAYGKYHITPSLRRRAMMKLRRLIARS